VYSSNQVVWHCWFVLSITYSIAWQACSIDQSLLNLYTLPSLTVNYTQSCHVIFAIYQTSAYPNYSYIYCGCHSQLRGVGNEQFLAYEISWFLISPWFPSKMTSYVVKVGGAGGLGWFSSLISRKSALISHDFNFWFLHEVYEISFVANPSVSYYWTFLWRVLFCEDLCLPILFWNTTSHLARALSMLWSEVLLVDTHSRPITHTSWFKAVWVWDWYRYCTRLWFGDPCTSLYRNVWEVVPQWINCV